MALEFCQAQTEFGTTHLKRDNRLPTLSCTRCQRSFNADEAFALECIERRIQRLASELLLKMLQCDTLGILRDLVIGCSLSRRQIQERRILICYVNSALRLRFQTFGKCCRQDFTPRG